MSEDEPIEDIDYTAVLGDPDYVQAVEDGNKAWKSLKRRTAAIWEDWKVLGAALIQVRHAAMTLSGANDTSSDRYRQVFHALLSRTAFADIDKNVRSKLLSLMEHLDVVDPWWHELPIDKQLRWTHPTTIWKQFNAKKPDPKGPEVEEREEEEMDDSDELEDAIPGSSGKVKIGPDAAANVQAIVQAIDVLLVTTEERAKLLKDMAAGLRKAV